MRFLYSFPLVSLLLSLPAGAASGGGDPLSGQENATVQEIPVLTQFTFTQVIAVPANATSVPVFSSAALWCQLDMDASNEARIIPVGDSFVLGSESTQDVSVNFPSGQYDATTMYLYSSVAALNDSADPSISLVCTYPYFTGIPTIAELNTELVSSGITLLIPPPVDF